MATSPLAAALAQLEGFGQPSAIPTLANNPGDLELGDVGYGTTQAAGGNLITNFPTLDAGWAALENQASKITSGTSPLYPPGTTVQQAGTTYSGGNPAYGQNLANATGVSPNTPVSQLANGSNSSAPSSSPNTGVLSWITNPLGNLFGVPTASGNAFTLSRVIILILGIILFGAGLFAFKQTQTIIQTGTNVVKKGASIGAAVTAL